MGIVSVTIPIIISLVSLIPIPVASSGEETSIESAPFRSMCLFVGYGRQGYEYEDTYYDKEYRGVSCYLCFASTCF